jgi:hypothetical protein
MKTSHKLACFAAVALLGFVLGRIDVPSAQAQVAAPNAAPRYQVSAWALAGNPSRPNPEHGCLHH